MGHEPQVQQLLNKHFVTELVKFDMWKINVLHADSVSAETKLVSAENNHKDVPGSPKGAVHTSTGGGTGGGLSSGDGGGLA
jgi:hypothetical protein